MVKTAADGDKPISANRINIAKSIISPKVLDEIKDILETGQMRQGRRVEEFETPFAERVAAKYAYTVNSGTAALHSAYLSTLKPGDEAIVPSLKLIATASMVHYSMAKPVFADSDPETLLIDVDDAKKKVT